MNMININDFTNFDGRKVLLSARTGSWNCNLQTEESDQDVKAFLMPSFHDLYHRQYYHEHHVTKTVDYGGHDIRRFVEFLFKANIAYLEVLESDQLVYDMEYLGLQEVVSQKEDIYRMNLPHLYASCVGQYQNKRRKLMKPTEGTQHLIDQHGYNTKEALHAYRNLDFLLRFQATGFEDFAHSLRYQDLERDFMLGIKHGKYPLHVIELMLDQLFETVERKAAPVYKKQLVDHDLKQELDVIVYDMIMAEITNVT